MSKESLYLNELLVQCLNLLRSVGEAFWSAKIEAVLENENSSSSARSVLEWYGGMGSFSDLMICRINGHDVLSEDESTINEKLSVLRSEIYMAANSAVKAS